VNTEEYAAAQALITAAVVNYVLRFARFFAAPFLTPKQWMGLLELMFPEVQRRREQSAVLAREFYDAERARSVPQLPRNDQPLEPYEFDWFVQAMEPLRVQMSAENASDKVVAQMALAAAREVENGGRRQIIHAVEKDSALTEFITADERVTEPMPQGLKDELEAILSGEEPQTYERPTWGGQTVTETKPKPVKRSNLVQGWARVATGDETCSYCLMLVSREPLYTSPKTAGYYGEQSEEELVEMFNRMDLETYFLETDALNDEFKKWHIGCDCKVVPVFDKANWFGKKAQKRAKALWDDAAKDAAKYRRDNPGRRKVRGENKGDRYTKNEDTLLALRRDIDNGKISSKDWAALQAA